MAEVMMRRRAERDDELRMLAWIAQGLGWEDMEDYEPPSETMRTLGRDAPPEHRTADRRLRIAELAEAGGGDVA